MGSGYNNAMDNDFKMIGGCGNTGVRCARDTRAQGVQGVVYPRIGGYDGGRYEGRRLAPAVRRVLP